LYYEGIFSYGKEHCADGKEFRYQGGSSSLIYSRQLVVQGSYILGEKNGPFKISDYSSYVSVNKDIKVLIPIYQDLQTLFVSYKSGKLDGLFRGYLENGKLGSVGRFKNGHLQQDHTQVLHMNGQIQYIGAFKAGPDDHGNSDRHGYGKQYRWEGTLSYFGNFVNDNKHGVGHQFYKNGNLKYSGGFINDDIHSKEVTVYDKHGNIEYIGDAKQGYYNNQGIFYDQDGKIKVNTYTGLEPCYSYDPENNDPWRYASEDWIACRCTECDQKLDYSHKNQVGCYGECDFCRTRQGEYYISLRGGRCYCDGCIGETDEERRERFKKKRYSTIYDQERSLERHDWCPESIEDFIEISKQMNPSIQQGPDDDYEYNEWYRSEDSDGADNFDDDDGESDASDEESTIRPKKKKE
jgi:hypothetical protein